MYLLSWDNWPFVTKYATIWFWNVPFVRKGENEVSIIVYIFCVKINTFYTVFKLWRHLQIHEVGYDKKNRESTMKKGEGKSYLSSKEFKQQDSQTPPVWSRAVLALTQHLWNRDTCTLTGNSNLTNTTGVHRHSLLVPKRLSLPTHYPYSCYYTINQHLYANIKLSSWRTKLELDILMQKMAK